MPDLDIILVAGTKIILALFVAFLAAAILLAIYRNRIDISLLISEKTGEASMSRFQLLVFTFVVSVSLFLIVLDTGEFPALPPEILTLLGMSGATYVISKGIQQSKQPPPVEDPPKPPKNG